MWSWFFKGKATQDLLLFKSDTEKPWKPHMNSWYKLHFGGDKDQTSIRIWTNIIHSHLFLGGFIKISHIFRRNQPSKVFPFKDSFPKLTKAGSHHPSITHPSAPSWKGRLTANAATNIWYQTLVDVGWMARDVGDNFLLPTWKIDSSPKKEIFKDDNFLHLKTWKNLNSSKVSKVFLLKIWPQVPTHAANNRPAASTACNGGDSWNPQNKHLNLLNLCNLCSLVADPKGEMFASKWIN